MQKVFEAMTDQEYINQVETMSKADFLSTIKSIPNGARYSVYFTKRGDGNLRQLTTVKGVTKGVKGVGLSYNPNDYRLLILFDSGLAAKGTPADKCWRAVPFDNISFFAWAGRRFRII